MEPITTEILVEFLNRLGQRFPDQATLYLLGGSALLLLGNPRQTLDIDYTTDLNPEQQQALENTMNQLASQYRLDIESVPIAEFIPLPPEAETRRRFIGRFGQIDVYLYDLYTIALSKIARGFDRLEPAASHAVSTAVDKAGSNRSISVLAAIFLTGRINTGKTSFEMAGKNVPQKG